MEFDFLPKLPNSNLDDRQFKDLVEECLLRVPRYCPEWSNHNPSDPGITMVELFGWLTDQMMMRFNQVPRRNYVAFLELLGVRLQPPAPAHTPITFYLAASLPEPYQIPAAVEVATERTETDEAIVFSTDRPLTIGLPYIHHLLTADTAEQSPNVLQDRLSVRWTRQANGHWRGSEQAIFNPTPQAGNSFYLVLDPDQLLEGNVIALNFEGETATPTGIRPEAPPRKWEAWDGQSWVSVLMQESDDETRGFSFYDTGSSSDIQRGEVVLHLPQQFPITDFASYRGRWLRCVCIEPAAGIAAYSSSPRLLSVAARSIGGTIDSSQCTLIQDELLGESNGQPGQRFQLQSHPILPRDSTEYLTIILPNGVQQDWQEVNDFADSGPEDYHYTLDSLTGMLQFGPLIREPGQLKTATRVRSQQQSNGTTVLTATPQLLERQYGAVPPRGAIITMQAYRTGGGQRGNVQPHTLRVVKSAVPYVASVINYGAAYHGADAESLDEAVLRVPRLLRTRDRAITPEDFEALAIEASQGAVARSICPKQINNQPGVVSVMLVPQANTASIETAMGISPEAFDLTPQLTDQVTQYLDERRPLGVQVKLHSPDYVGVTVKTEVAIDSAYNAPEAQQAILHDLQVALYRFLNPLVGGREGQGWPFGTAVHPSDIITLLQGVTGVRYLGAVMLYEVRKQATGWVRQLAPDNIVKPGPLGLVCSWTDSQLRSGHTISLIS